MATRRENVKFYLEIVGVMVLAAYTTFAALQWGQMKRATEIAQTANADAWALADRANKTAIDAERPWVGMNIAILDWEIGKNPKAVVEFTNSGRRPARATLVEFDKGDFKVFPQNPPYHKYSTDVKSVVLILPNSFATNSQPLDPLTQERMNALGSRQITLFVYANIEYEDILTQTEHWTHGCWQFLPGFQNTSGGFVNCATYNDVDQNENAIAQPDARSRANGQGDPVMTLAWYWILNHADRIISLVAIVIAVIAIYDVRHLFRTTQERDRTAILRELNNYGASMSAFYRACQYLEFRPGELDRESAALLFATFRIQQLLSPNATKEELSELQKSTRNDVDKTARGYMDLLISSDICKLKDGWTLPTGK
jgi:hypothetical protein